VTLIVAANSDGVYGRCNAKCHDAKKPKCHCICRGAFHGKGSGSAQLFQALDRGETLLKRLFSDGQDVSGAQGVLARGFPASQMSLGF